MIELILLIAGYVWYMAPLLLVAGAWMVLGFKGAIGALLILGSIRSYLNRIAKAKAKEEAKAKKKKEK